MNTEYTKSFQSVMEMWEFFNDNSHYKMIRYVPENKGILVYYEIVS